MNLEDDYDIVGGLFAVLTAKLEDGARDAMKKPIPRPHW
jgi:hypothetical protein